jgi:hypothetical protein
LWGARLNKNREKALPHPTNLEESSSTSTARNSTLQNRGKSFLFSQSSDSCDYYFLYTNRQQTSLVDNKQHHNQLPNSKAIYLRSIKTVSKSSRLLLIIISNKILHA